MKRIIMGIIVGIMATLILTGCGQAEVNEISTKETKTVVSTVAQVESETEVEENKSWVSDEYLAELEDNGRTNSYFGESH